MIRIIDLAMAREAVDKVIARAGEDYHYKSHRDSCEYHREDASGFTGVDMNPDTMMLGCIVGEAMLELGFDSDDMLPGSIAADRLPLGVQLTQQAMTFLSYAQTAQDGTMEPDSEDVPFPGGSTWGQARDYANAKVAKIHGQ